MASVNKVILIGNLGRDPEIRTTPQGTSLARFSVATSTAWKDASGAKQERTEWHDVVAWEKLAQICGEYLHKGKMVYVEGSLQTRSWEDQNGQKRYKTEIKASNEKGGVDAKLDKLKAKLSKPPFASYDTFKLLGEHSVNAERGKPAPVKLANGSLTLLFKDKLTASGGKTRLRFGIDVDDKQGARTISTESKFDSGDPFFIAGQPYDGGTYVLALTCNAP